MKPSEKEIRGSYFAYRTATIFPATAIRADLSRQNYSVFPRGYYVDILKTCRRCKVEFVFSAREQQHWYEELGFYVDADCVHCLECRRSNQQLKRRFRRYSDTVSLKTLDDRSLKTLLGDAVYLWKAGVLRDEQRLRTLRNRGQRQVPGCRELNAIDRLLGEQGTTARRPGVATA